MNVDQIFGQVRPILKLAGAICVLVAAAKLFGFSPGIMGSVEGFALVGIGLMQV